MDDSNPDAGARPDAAPGPGPEAIPEPGEDAGFDVLAVMPRLTQLGVLVNRSGLTERMKRRAGLRIDRPAMSVLLTLHFAGGSLRVGEIAHRMQVVGPHVTRQVNELERRGLVRRAADPDDQRARLIELTPAGEEAVGAYKRVMLAWFSGVLADWPEHDRREFGRLLERFVDDLAARLSSLDEGEDFSL